MRCPTIAILSPGQMGSSFALLLHHTSPSPLRVLSPLSTRSARTRSLALASGIEDAPLSQIVREAEIVLSIVVPDKARTVAEEVAAALLAAPEEERRVRFFVELNAVAPSTALACMEHFEGLQGVAFVDGGIIGGPASVEGAKASAPLVVLSGPAAKELDKILGPFFVGRTKVVGEEVGQASALKLAYASLTKGSTALAVNASLLGKVWGVGEALLHELGESQPALSKVVGTIPRSTAKAFRWVGEMDEIASAYSSVGLQGGAQLFQGASTTYGFVAANETLGSEKIEVALDKGRTIDDVSEILARDLPQSPRQDRVTR